MIQQRTLYSLDDLMIEPARVSRVKHREDVITHWDGLDGRWLPIFTAPMPCVVSLKDNQFMKYVNANIRPIIPRTEPLIQRLAFLKKKKYSNIFVAFSLDEFNENFIKNQFEIPDKIDSIKVLIDIANGNMDDLHTAIKLAKCLYKMRMIIMSGNIACPQAFYELASAGCDYIRCSVGSGSGCCTATYTGVYYPMGSLIDECNVIRNQFCLRNIKIIADGGITTYRNAFKALALGADYVMMGSRLCQCEDSAGEIINLGETLKRKENKRKLYFGMASEMGSQLLGKDATAPEGMVKEYPILPPIAEYARLFSRYLSSTMSYCNASNLDEFVGRQILNPISQSAQKQFNQ